MFSKRELRVLPHHDRIKAIKNMRKHALSYLKPRPKYFPRFAWVKLVQIMHNVSNKQLKKIK